MGFFNNPRKATKAFFKDPVKIINNDISNFEKATGIQCQQTNPQELSEHATQLA